MINSIINPIIANRGLCDSLRDIKWKSNANSDL